MLQNGRGMERPLRERSLKLGLAELISPQPQISSFPFNSGSVCFFTNGGAWGAGRGVGEGGSRFPLSKTRAVG